MSKNMVEPERPQTIWRIRVACPKATRAQARARSHTHTHTHTHTHKYVILIAFPLQQWFANAPQCYVLHTLPVLFSDFPNSRPFSDRMFLRGDVLSRKNVCCFTDISDFHARLSDAIALPFVAWSSSKLCLIIQFLPHRKHTAFSSQRPTN
jgi:hypothetical protein